MLLVGTIKLFIKIGGIKGSLRSMTWLFVGRKTFLIAHLCNVEQDINLTCIAKMWSISSSLKHLQDHSPAAVSDVKPLFAELQGQYGIQLICGEVLKLESLVYWKASTETRIDLLKHLFHLVFVA